MAKLILKHTPTLGVRRYDYSHYSLQCHVERFVSSFGPIQMKITQDKDILRVKPEFEDVNRITREYGICYHEAYRKIVSE